jgi:hypothetical protein
MRGSAAPKPPPKRKPPSAANRRSPRKVCVEFAKYYWKIAASILLVLYWSFSFLSSANQVGLYFNTISFNDQQLTTHILFERKLPEVKGDIVHNFRFPKQRHSPDAVTLITQLSCRPHARLQVMQSLVSQWDGPASVAVFIMSPDEVEAVATLYDSDPIMQKHVALHLVYMDNSTLANPMYKEYGVPTIYPVNKLRNTALVNALSDWVLYVDCDFTIVPNRHDQVQPMIAHELSSRKDKTVPESKLVFVLPAFELSPDETPPTNKVDLFRMYADKDSTMQFFAKKRCPPCHGATLYDKFFAPERATEGSYMVPYALK